MVAFSKIKEWILQRVSDDPFASKNYEKNNL